MARIPDSEIERIKNEVSVERLVESAGIALKKSGVARRAPIASLPNYPSNDFGKIGAIFPQWRRPIFPARPRLYRTASQIAVVAASA